LADRIETITLPGGGKATFETKIEKARQQIDEILVESDSARPQLPTQAKEFPDRELVEMAETIPEYVVIAAYADIEKTLIQLARQLGQPITNQRPVPGFIGYLEGIKLIMPEASDALIDLYQARNIATHAKGQNRISPGQAIEFLRQSRILQEALQRALVSAKKNDQKKIDPTP